MTVVFSVDLVTDIFMSMNSTWIVVSRENEVTVFYVHEFNLSLTGGCGGVVPVDTAVPADGAAAFVAASRHPSDAGASVTGNGGWGCHRCSLLPVFVFLTGSQAPDAASRKWETSLDAPLTGNGGWECHRCPLLTVLFFLTGSQAPEAASPKSKVGNLS